MTRSFFVLLLLLITAPAQGQLFTQVDGDTNGCNQAITDWLGDPISNWTWGVVGFDDATGRHLILQTHNGAGPLGLLKLTRQADGSYSKQILSGMGFDYAPFMVDMNNDGVKDVIPVGVSNGRGGALFADGTFRVDEISYSVISARRRGTWVGKDWIGAISNDSRDSMTEQPGYGRARYLDHYYEPPDTTPGKWTSVKWRKVTTKANDALGRMVHPTRRLEPIPDGLDDLPDSVKYIQGMPEAVTAKLAEMYGDQSSTSNRYCGPEAWCGDLNGDGREDCVVSYHGSYGGGKYIWNAVMFRDETGQLVEQNAVPTNLAISMPPIDLTGDGLPELIAIRGPKNSDGSYPQGIYRSEGGGSYTKLDTAILDANLQNPGSYEPNRFFQDFNNDGLTDFVITKPRLGGGAIGVQNPDHTFTVLHSISIADAEGATVHDVDGDGDQDVVTWSGGQRAKNLVIYYNNTDPSPNPDPDPDPTPDPDPVPTESLMVTLDGAPVEDASAVIIKDGVDVTEELLKDNDVEIIITTPDVPDPPAEPTSRVIIDGVEIQFASLDVLITTPDVPDPDPTPDPDPLPDPTGAFPVQPYDITSDNWARYANYRDRSPSLMFRIAGDESYRQPAIDAAQGIVDKDDVAGNQYLGSGGKFHSLFRTLAWCDPPDEQKRQWIDWGMRHLGEPDGSVKDSIWWSSRWARNYPGNNYYHSFVKATSSLVWVTDDEKWMKYLKGDRLPLLYNYYSRTPEGGSREGTGYGESHRTVFTLARDWQEFDGTKILPDPFVDNSASYWVNAIAPGHAWVALIGDHTRTHGRTDGYHRNILESIYELTDDPQADALCLWELSYQKPMGSAVFYGLELKDYPELGDPIEGSPPESTEYAAVGAGHYFSRTSWNDDATYVYFVCGKLDEAHAQDDQGSFAVFADGKYQTCSDSPWTHGGIAQHPSEQNVVRFGSERQKRGKSGVMEQFEVVNNVLLVKMDLTEVAGHSWRREIKWDKSQRSMHIRDYCDTVDNNGQLIEFGFEKPSADDTRAPWDSTCTCVTETLPDGFSSVVSW